MSRKENILRRKLIAKLIDQFYYRPENASRCHKQVYKRFARFLCSVNYDTFMDDLKDPVPDNIELPYYIVDGLQCMVDTFIRHPETRTSRQRRRTSIARRRTVLLSEAGLKRRNARREMK